MHFLVGLDMRKQKCASLAGNKKPSLNESVFSLHLDLSWYMISHGIVFHYDWDYFKIHTEKLLIIVSRGWSNAESSTLPGIVPRLP